jgi:hypothetical protein
MPHDGMASLWVGSAESVKALKRYLETHYTDDRDAIPIQLGFFCPFVGSRTVNVDPFPFSLSIPIDP